MSYHSHIKQAKMIHVSGNITVPPSYHGATHFMIPDQIVEFCVEHYELLNYSAFTLDPMCGFGTIPRVINALGGQALGIEIDVTKYHLALEIMNQNHLILGIF